MKKYRVDVFLYHIGKIIWLPVLIAGSWFAKWGYAKVGEVFACNFYKVCGFPCPGCGGTRAVYQLFLGNLTESFWYHPAVLYIGVCYVHFMVLYFWRKHFSKCKRGKEIAIAGYLYGLMVVILLQWGIKLITGWQNIA